MINSNISLNRDLGEYSLNALYTNLIKIDLTEYFQKPVNINIEPVTNRPLRLAAKKARLALKLVYNYPSFFHFKELPCFISLYLSVQVELR